LHQSLLEYGDGIKINSEEYEDSEDDQDDEGGIQPEMKVLLVSKDKLKCKVFYLLFCSYLSANPVVWTPGVSKAQSTCIFSTHIYMPFPASISVSLLTCQFTMYLHALFLTKN
jgi:hypothetical protein